MELIAHFRNGLYLIDPRYGRGGSNIGDIWTSTRPGYETYTLASTFKNTASIVESKSQEVAFCTSNLKMLSGQAILSDSSGKRFVETFQTICAEHEHRQ